MKAQSVRRGAVLLSLFALLGALFASSAGASIEPGEKPSKPEDTRIPGHYIVVFKDSVKGPATVARNQVEQSDGDLGFVYRHAIKGYSAELSKTAVDVLRRDPRVDSVTPDYVIEAAAQTISTGIDRISANEHPTADIDGIDDARVDVDVAVIDSGIDAEHPDLDVEGRANCVAPGEKTTEQVTECVNNSGTDGNGHGTASAGAIGAIDNGYGVVGVAPGARLWSVRVFNNQNKGAGSWVLAAVNWVVGAMEDEDPDNDIEVANVSVSGAPESLTSPLSKAIEAARSAGVVVVAAAGNESIDGIYHGPGGSNPHVITVSALADHDGKPGEEDDSLCFGFDDTLASFSNFGESIDIAAPGACTLTTALGGGVAVVSGTSIAAPYVSGAAALLASESNPEDKEDVEAIKQTLIDTGSLDWNDNSGDAYPEPVLNLGPPKLSAATASATDIDAVAGTATLRGVLNPAGLATTYKFEYGLTDEYGQSSPASPKSAGSEVKYTKVSESIGGLELDQTYHYRIVATNSSGPFYGKDRTFVMPSWAVEPSLLPGDFGSGGASGISCTSLRSCVITGAFEEGSGFARWNGSEWRRQKRPVLPAGGVSGGFTSVSCPSQSNCIATGQYKKAAGITLPLAGHWNGKQWTSQAIPVPPEATESRVLDVSCASSTACVGIGTYRDGSETPAGFPTRLGFFAHWDGASWTANTTSRETTRDFSGQVSCSSASFCIAVRAVKKNPSNPSSSLEAPLVERWDGAEWQVEEIEWPESGGEPAPTADLESVSCASATACTAVGTYGNHETLAERWDGTEWTIQATPQPTSPIPQYPMDVSLRDVTCTSSTACTAIGEGHQRSFLTGTSFDSLFAMHWDGSTWTLQGSFRGDAGLERSQRSVACIDADAEICVAVGRTVDGEERSRPLVLSRGPRGATQSATHITSVKALLGASISPMGRNTSYQFEYGTTEQYGSKVPASPKGIGAGNEAVEVEEAIEGLKPNTTYHYRVVAANDLATIQGEDRTFTTSQLAVALTFGKSGAGPGELVLPRAIDVDSEGNIWIADTENHRIQKFDPEGDILAQFGEEGSGSVQFMSPQGIVVDDEDNVWVSDTGNDRVQMLDGAGEYLFELGEGGASKEHLDEPRGIAIGVEGNLLIANSDRVSQFSPEGEYLDSIDQGWDFHLLDEPSDVAVDPEGDIWIADTGKHRILEFGTSSQHLGGELLSEIGEQGSEGGEFVRPEGIAVDAEGNVWVADTGNDRIQKLTSNGKYVFQVGEKGVEDGQFEAPSGIVINPSGGLLVADTGNDRVQEWKYPPLIPKVPPSPLSTFGKTGAANGEFKEPYGAATDSKGNVWIADYTNNRIQKFDSAGKYLDQAGSTGSGNGQFKGPTDVVVDSEDNVWVSDSGNSRVQKLDSEGNYLDQFGSFGSGAGQFKAPWGLGIDDEDNVWVADILRHVVQEFNAEGEQVFEVGSQGAGEGEFDAPTDVAVDPEGNVWVTESFNHRVQKLTSEGEYLAMFGEEGTAPGEFKNPVRIAVDDDGNAWISNLGNARVQALDSNGSYLFEFGEAGAGEGQFDSAYGLAIDGGSIWVTDAGSNDRVQKWGYVPTPFSTFGKTGSANGEFKEPYGAATDSKGNVWVADYTNNRIQKFDSAGKYLDQAGSIGSGNGQFKGPGDVVVDSEDNVWVSDSGNNRVQKFDSEGNYLDQFGSEGAAPGKFKTPWGLGVDAEDNVWVADLLNHRVQKFDSEGGYELEIGSGVASEGEGEFNTPTDVAVDSEGNIWVTESLNHRVQKLDPEGEHLAMLGEEGTGAGEFKNPVRVAIDDEDDVWVTDLGNDRVQALDSNGGYLFEFGETGAGEGQFDSAYGLAIDGGSIWVTDAGSNDRVQKWVR
ncbi:MAG TPA: S8 family serine peptidase [Solirubrobacterales bacterium]|nr:S8 family serine peptidase [Solirubrobacterales bacterium]